MRVVTERGDVLIEGPIDEIISIHQDGKQIWPEPTSIWKRLFPILDLIISAILVVCLIHSHSKRSELEITIAKKEKEIVEAVRLSKYYEERAVAHFNRELHWFQLWLELKEKHQNDNVL